MWSLNKQCSFNVAYACVCVVHMCICVCPFVFVLLSSAFIANKRCSFQKTMLLTWQAPGKAARHHALNDVVARACSSACTQSPRRRQVRAARTVNTPTAWLSSHGRQVGRSVVWDVTVTCTTAVSLDTTARTAGAAAELAQKPGSG